MNNELTRVKYELNKSELQINQKLIRNEFELTMNALKMNYES